MLTLQNTKVFNAIEPGIIKDDAAYTANVIDTANINYLEFHIPIGTIDADLAAFKVMESDEKTDATTLGGVPTEVVDVTTKPGAADGGKVWIIGVEFKTQRKRYMQLQATAGDGAAGTYLAATGVAEMRGNVSGNAADRGVEVAQYA